MEGLTSFKLVVLLSGLVVACLLVVGQTLHIFFVAAKDNGTLRRPLLLYEALVTVYLMLIAASLYAGAAHWEMFVVRFYMLRALLEPLMWVNAGTALLGLFLCVRLRAGSRIPKILILAATTPLVLGFMAANGDSLLALLLLISQAYFVFQVTRQLLQDGLNQKSQVSRFSVTEAIMRLPEGILITDDHGKIVLLNDAMRLCLANLNLPADLTDGREVWAELERRGQENPVHAASHGLILTVSANNRRLFTNDTVTLRGKQCQRMLAVDVTVEEELNRDLAAANLLLEASSRELRGALENVDRVARDSALLQVHSRVHDVIGQRLSILHRYLEEGDVSIRTIAQIQPLLTEILEDLSDVQKADYAAEMQAIVRAFSLVNVEIRVSGTLPPDPEVAAVFLQVMRESVTNAVQHGHARTVQVSFGEISESYQLTVTNTAQLGADRKPGSGRGIPGMRAAIEGLGGNLNIVFPQRESTSFALTATVPRTADLAVTPVKGMS